MARSNVVVQRTVRISTDPMSLTELVAVARGARVELAPEALERIARSRRLLDEAIERDEAIYGVTTGVGHARNNRLPREGLLDWQTVLVEMHVGAMGDALPVERVRAGIAARLSGFARGGSGISPEVVRLMVELLNHGIHPVIQDRGSVGAADLSQLALVARVVIGRGDVEVDGRRMPAAEALASAGLAPVRLHPKDALALISSNALAIGHAGLLLGDLGKLVELADAVVATSMEAMHANPSIVDPAVASVRGSTGQRVSSDRIRQALTDSRRTGLLEQLAVQDPISFRVVPQVHGAARDALLAAADAATAELNAASDNPLVDLGSGRILSNGNFHPMNLALASESLRLGLCHVGLLCDRRMGHLWDGAVTSFWDPAGEVAGAAGIDGVPPALAGLALRYAAAARYSRLRQLAAPVTLDVPVLDLAVEDHATNLAETLAVTEEAAAIVEELLVVEMLIAVALLGPDPDLESLGIGTRELVWAVHDEIGRAPKAGLPHEIHRRVLTRLRTMSFDPDADAGPPGGGK